MGLLDEAIRDHLELKRRRGADPGEVARQEHEVLGTSRWEQHETSESAAAPASMQPAAPEPEPWLDEPTGHGPEPGAHRPESSAHRPESGAHGPESGAHGPEAAAHRPEAAAHGPETAELDMAPLLDGPAEGERGSAPVAAPGSVSAPAPAPGPVPAPARPASGPTRRGGDEEAEHDVLHETPDFLQETPEHDRLWFEQQPPRDFDFDR